MAESLEVEKREKLGKLNNRRLRRAGRVPAVLYGHEKESVSLSALGEQVLAAFRHGARLFDLKGAVQESALLKSVQWDTYGVEVLHLDFVRIKAGQKVELVVGLEMRGTSPGVKEGGVVTQLVHELRLEVLPAEIPDRLHVSLSGLTLNGHLMVRDITDLPPSARVLADPEMILVQCLVPLVKDEEAPTEGAVEPELIGRKPAEEGAEEAAE